MTGTAGRAPIETLLSELPSTISNFFADDRPPIVAGDVAERLIGRWPDFLAIHAAKIEGLERRGFLPFAETGQAGATALAGRCMYPLSTKARDHLGASSLMRSA